MAHGKANFLISRKLDQHIRFFKISRGRLLHQDVDFFPEEIFHHLSMGFRGCCNDGSIKLESIKLFDPDDQRTIESIDEIFIHPVRDTVITADQVAKIDGEQIHVG